MRHDRVLQINSRDPLAPALDRNFFFLSTIFTQPFGSTVTMSPVLSQRLLWLRRAGLSWGSPPTWLSPLLRVVVDDPRARDAELTHRSSVPRKWVTPLVDNLYLAPEQGDTLPR